MKRYLLAIAATVAFSGLFAPQVILPAHADFEEVEASPYDDYVDDEAEATPGNGQKVQTPRTGVQPQPTETDQTYYEGTTYFEEEKTSPAANRRNRVLKVRPNKPTDDDYYEGDENSIVLAPPSETDTSDADTTGYGE